MRFDAADQLYVLDDEGGELWALDQEGERWSKRVISSHGTATDNMAMGADGLIYVSNMADNTAFQSWRAQLRRTADAAGQDRLGRRRHISDRAMWTHGVEVVTPALDQDLGLT